MRRFDLDLASWIFIDPALINCEAEDDAEHPHECGGSGQPARLQGPINVLQVAARDRLDGDISIVAHYFVQHAAIDGLGLRLQVDECLVRPIDLH